jgi:hypothetical protein
MMIAIFICPKKNPADLADQRGGLAGAGAMDGFQGAGAIYQGGPSSAMATARLDWLPQSFQQHQA